MASGLSLSRSCWLATIAVRSSKDRDRRKTTRRRFCFSFIVCRFCDQSGIRGIVPLLCSLKADNLMRLNNPPETSPWVG
jgi:hypothetical protein